MLEIRQQTQNQHGFFKVGAVVLNENDVMTKNALPKCSEDDFMIAFRDKNKIGWHYGKKHFRTEDEAIAFILQCNIFGFKKSDL